MPQPRGAGQLERVVEPTTSRPYYLYLPKDYVAADETARTARRWPMVVTFHGMKPYDTALYQAQEWQQEADRYGYVVVAPILMAFDFFTGEFPQRTINRNFKDDELATLAILDHAFATTHADPGNVLSTSWSSGGYMAHYMLNRHPDRFTCLAVRQSNFAATLLDSTWTAQSLYHPVLVLTTQNDVPICKEESREAIRWYESHGYKNFAWVYLKRLAHERTPDMAADFFARVAGVTPNRPPEVLANRQAIDGNPTGLALLAGRMGELQKAPTPAAPAETVVTVTAPRPTQKRPTMVAATSAPPTTPPPAPAAPADTSPPAAPTVVTADPTPPRGSAENSRRPVSPIGIRIATAVGFEPLLLTYTAECPVNWQRTASFYWALDGRLIGQGLNGQYTLTRPGDYRLELKVITQDGVEHRTERLIRVLKSAPDSAAPKSAEGGAPSEAAPRGRKP